jgi:hypothetical protein
MNLSDSQAQELAATLQQKRCTGSDDVALVTWLSNHFRIGKNESRALYDTFYTAFQKGADAAMAFIDGKTDQPQLPASADSLYRAAYRVGYDSFTAEFENARRRHRPSGCLTTLLILTAIITLLRAAMYS